jgi:hypothetical protein
LVLASVSPDTAWYNGDASAGGAAAESTGGSEGGGARRCGCREKYDTSRKVLARWAGAGAAAGDDAAALGAAMLSGSAGSSSTTRWWALGAVEVAKRASNAAE